MKKFIEKNMKNKEKIWITWESQRRSLELSKALECDFYLIEYSGFLRYPLSIAKTLVIIVKNSHKIIIVQNPSMILAAMVCFLKKLFIFKVVVDRHTTFRLSKRERLNIDWLVFNFLHRFTLRRADLTIVTNVFLSKIVKEIGGNPYVLQDKLPELKQTRRIELNKGFNILVISSFGEDEPVEEILTAASQLKIKNVNLYITGNCNKLSPSLIKNASSNVVFTNYVSEEDFNNFLFSVDAVMVLTTADCCMLCGCYEAVSAEKPLITSKKDVLVDYFSGSIFVENNYQDIISGVISLIKNYNSQLNNVKNLKSSMNKKWDFNFKKLNEKIINL